MAARKPPPGHFERGLGKPGWVYIARNDLHREDIYKVGYTEQTPESRVLKLNTEQRLRTSQIGFFHMAYAVAVLDSQGCEQALFKKIGKLRESPRKEFVNAPLELIIGELLQIQKKDNLKAQTRAVCENCGFFITYCPLPQVRHMCPQCEAPFDSTSHGVPNFSPRGEGRPVRYFGVGFSHEFRKHSPIAKAYLELRSACVNYLEGRWDGDEFFDEAERLLEDQVEFDRMQSATKPDKPARKRSYKTPKARKGWMDCPDCLSAIEITIEEPPICMECGWTDQGDE